MTSDVYAQEALKKYRPQACKDAGCVVTRHISDEGVVHIRHNEDPYLEIPDAWVADPSRDVWEGDVLPWLKGQHNAD